MNALEYLEQAKARPKSDFEGYVADLTEAIRLDPNLTEAFGRRAYAYASKGQFEQGIADMDECIRIEPTNAGFYENRGRMYDELGNQNAAIADYTEALRLDPDLPYVYYNRGLLYFQLGDYEKSLADNTEAIRGRPTHAQAYHNRGTAKQRLGDIEGALQDFARSIELENPEKILSHECMGRIYLKKRDMDKAISHFSEAIQLGTSYTGTYVSRGYAYAKLKQYELAIMDYQEAIRRNPDLADAYYDLAQIYRDIGDEAKAAEHAKRAQELDPTLEPPITITVETEGSFLKFLHERPETAETLRELLTKNEKLAKLLRNDDTKKD